MKNTRQILKLIKILSGAERVYVVGGWLRDKLLGRLNRDLDIASPKDPLRVAKKFAGAVKGRLVVLDKTNKIYRVIGKGNKERHCPLWPSTVLELHGLIANRDSSEPVFRNRCGQPITRYGIHTMVERHVKNASIHAPSLRKKRVSPHTIRHATAVHLLRAGVDINTIRAWLGHVSIDTTNIYAEIDMEMKAKALACCEIKNGAKLRKSWLKDPDLMRFLKSL